MNSKKVIVIGSGVAGLAAAIRLAVQGHQVTVFEKNDYPGGKLSHFNLGGFSFDCGPSLFTQPQNIEDIFEYAQEPVEDYFSCTKMEIACNYFFESGKVVHAYSNAQKFANELQTKVGEDPVKVQNYLLNSASMYNAIGTFFLDHSLHKLRSYFNKGVINALLQTKASYLLNSMNKYNADSFQSPETIQLFNRYATYNGSNPYTAPAMLAMIPHLEHNQGTYFPKGGMISITNALYQLAIKKGVKFRFGNPIEEIILSKDKVVGVKTSNAEIIEADTVVSNMDVYYTYKKLMNNSILAKKVLSQERSSSAIIFYWGINHVFDQLGLHNIFFSGDYKKEFDHIFNSKNLSDDPTIYINITSKCESEHAPNGKENWFVMVNAPHDVGQDWDQIKHQCRQQVISKLSRLLKINLEELIEVEETLDPTLIESRTSSYTGSLYGTSSNSKLAAFFRHPNFKKSIKGLYFVGGSVHPGGGIPLCLKSAKIVSDLIRKEYE